MNYRPGPKYIVRAFTSVEHAYLDTIEPYIGDKRFFVSGPEHKTLKLRPRELFGLIVMAYVLHFLAGGQWVPGTDPLGHDGVVMRIDNPKTKGEGRAYEQVFVPEMDSKVPHQSIEYGVLNAIKSKADKGEGYRSNTDLIVFVNRAGDIGDLRALADAAGQLGYDAVYMIAHNIEIDSIDEVSYLCVILSSPVYTRGPLCISIDRKTGTGHVERVMS
jgi:hypothetical protein